MPYIKTMVLEVHGPDDIRAINNMGVKLPGWRLDKDRLVHESGDYRPKWCTPALREAINEATTKGVFPADIPYCIDCNSEGEAVGLSLNGIPIYTNVGLRPEQRKDLSAILDHCLKSYPVGEDLAALVAAEFESCVDGWLGGTFTPGGDS